MSRFFPIKAEQHMRQRILREHREEIGTTVLWYVWIPDEMRQRRHPIYAEGGEELGREWHEPVRVPVIDALMVEGEASIGGEGMSISDTLQVFVTRRDLDISGLHDLKDNRNLHYRDRIEAKGKIWVPIQIEGVGKFRGQDSGAAVVAREVQGNERVLDEQWDVPPNWGPYGGPPEVG